ncbi:hypothetical protein quinque_007092 [Culex quinquefasciatus]|uniref:uncharacterized protein LOC119765985 n=1 Tax=Culex quinquefasciatus TaxID=7176 RepID=UPI0018E33469|nr:uncharacterized protein LOC119765985 [Culex quinquefasciatus]
MKGLMEQKLQDELDAPYSNFATRYVGVFPSSRRITLPEESSWCIVINFKPSWNFTGILNNPFEYVVWISVLITTAIIVLLIKRFVLTYRFLILLTLSIVYIATSASHLSVAKFNPDWAAPCKPAEETGKIIIIILGFTPRTCGVQSSKFTTDVALRV